ncbi:MAG TPA: hypothetical protein VI702_06655 [Nitrospiria bacterium]
MANTIRTGKIRPDDKRSISDRRDPIFERRQDDRRCSEQRAGERRTSARRMDYCPGCDGELTPAAYCPRCRVRVVKIRLPAGR